MDNAKKAGHFAANNTKLVAGFASSMAGAAMQSQ